MTADSFDRNPLWTDTPRIVSAIRDTGVVVSSVLADFVIEQGYARCGDWLGRLHDAAAKIGAGVMVLPFLESQSWRDRDEARRALDAIVTASPRERMAGIAIESDWRADDLTAVLDGVPEDIGICLDAGNCAAAGHVPSHEARILNTRVRHVHLKDRPFNAASVMLGHGDADIAAFLAAIHDVKYDGALILETPRGDDPERAATANLAVVRAAVPA